MAMRMQYCKQGGFRLVFFRGEQGLLLDGILEVLWTDLALNLFNAILPIPFTQSFEPIFSKRLYKYFLLCESTNPLHFLPARFSLSFRENVHYMRAENNELL